MYHQGLTFSTKDNDNDHDDRLDTSCAQMREGGWWYKSCYQSNLNGVYLGGNQSYPLTKI